MTGNSLRLELADSAKPYADKIPLLEGRPCGAHPAVIKIAMSAVAWFLAVVWLNFAGNAEVDTALAVSTGLFVVFFTLLLVAVSAIVDHPR